ncbi:unnamed protein product [Acidithrix sp. C25]|nr:unnamed protein product [Acidithrix sp. C25]
MGAMSGNPNQTDGARSPVCKGVEVHVPSLLFFVHPDS